MDDGLSPKAIEHNLTKSLKRLETDYVDIYYAHRYDASTAPEEVAQAMNKEIKRGRIRHYAVSNYTGNQLLDSPKCMRREWFCTASIVPAFLISCES